MQSRAERAKLLVPICGFDGAPTFARTLLRGGVSLCIRRLRGFPSGGSRLSHHEAVIRFLLSG